MGQTTLLAIVLSIAIGFLSAQRTPNGLDTQEFCRNLTGHPKPSNSTKVQDGAISFGQIEKSALNCFYYPRCRKEVLEYETVDVFTEDLQTTMFANGCSKCAKYHECLMFTAYYCHKGPCDKRRSIRKCTNNNPILPADDWPCFLDDVRLPKRRYRSSDIL